MVYGCALICTTEEENIRQTNKMKIVRNEANDAGNEAENAAEVETTIWSEDVTLFENKAETSSNRLF